MIRILSEDDKDKFAIFISTDYSNRQNSNTQQFSIACCTVPVVYLTYGIETFWKNYQEGFLFIIRHLLKMFQCKITTSARCYESDLFQPTVSELLNQQVEFKALTILHTQNMLFNRKFSNFGLIEDLRIISVTHPGFRPVFSSWPQKISIKSSHWFTLESFLTCTSTNIILEESCLVNKDLDVVLRKWKAGGYQNLKYLKIHSLRTAYNGEHVLEMNWMELNGKVIQNDDGSKKATIELGPQSIEIYVTPFE
ncbi:hypothetical protein GCK72_002991 [Caenorhabditis remanei]|uniref:Sdz-33 F-box domain-containing protein n=1 Tax=Caenorhabditis remanei TaxID=31234 RepID=A0A6A5HUA3_CAERE|nr:hypothetical protein GCK72_002991 [Caenorhabditis remanei]KAF1771165.1 hypothetical protein GCK72_002991 [Caenorhabditis remanei]